MVEAAARVLASAPEVETSESLKVANVDSPRPITVENESSVNIPPKRW